uniref:FAD/NAD(P)-binding domain-containing protein n=1 Tax=Smittium simulii TaxID=133385 RepID=A0A2T9YQF0_9FUNG|nr:hypothetical protein BB561_002475 [Smittium simulii]
MLKSKDNFKSLKKRYDNQRAEPPVMRPPSTSSSITPSKIDFIDDKEPSIKNSIFSFSNKSFISSIFNSSKRDLSNFDSNVKPKSRLQYAFNTFISQKTTEPAPKDSFRSSMAFDNSTSSSQFKVVILGGSVAAICAARYIEERCQKLVSITIIEPLKKVFLKTGASSSLTDNTSLNCLFVSPENIFKLSQNSIIRDKAVLIQEGHVGLSMGPPIPFDYLVIATGSSYPPPISYPSLDYQHTANMLTRYFQTLNNAKSVLIIGGGATGVEVCLRLINNFYQKNIAIIHDKDLLLNHDYSESYRKKIQQKLIDSKVKLILNDTAKISSFINYGHPPKGRWIETTSGKMLFFDIQINCSGPTGNSDFLKKSHLDYDNVVEKQSKFIKVNRYLQILDSENIFAVGDVNNISGVKNVERAKSQARCISKNIGLLLQKKLHPETFPVAKLSVWVPDSINAEITLHKNENIPSNQSKLQLINSFKSEHYINNEVSFRKAETIKKIYKLYNAELGTYGAL